MANINKNVSKSIIVLLAIIFVLTSLRLLWFYIHHPSEQVLIEDGILDLSNSDVSNHITSLQGEWMFFPNQFIYEADETNNIDMEMDESKTVVSDRTDEDTFQYGTYYTKIILPEDTDLTQLYSIRIPSMKTASALYVNGQLKGQSGTVAATENKHVGKGYPYVATFPVDSNEIEFVLQVSNFDTTQGIRLGSPIKFGLEKAIAKNKSFEDILLMSLVIILVLHSIYSLLLFIITRKYVMLFFAIGFLLPAIDELLTYNSASMEWLGFNYEWSFKFKELVYLGAAFFLVQLMKNLLKDFKRYKRFRMLAILYAICAIFTLILPINLLIQVNLFFFIVYFISFVAVIPLAMKEYFTFNDESFYIAIVIVGVTSGITWGLIKAILPMDIPFYPFDYLVAFLGFAFFWFKRFYRQNKQVVELVDKLEAEDKNKDKFLANTSHELRNPLHGIINIAQTMIDDEEELLSKRNKDKLELLMNVAQRMSYTLNDLQDITRLKENKVRLNRKHVHIQAVISGTLDILRYMTDGKNVQFVVKIPHSFPVIYADKNRLIQVLFNFIHNAIKYTNEGTITIRAQHDEKFATIYIQDTGIGMSEVEQKRIFEPYEQLDNMNPLGSGVGLGLSISKQLVELHGGTVSVESKIDEGSTFSFTIPIANAIVDETEDMEEIDMTKYKLKMATEKDFQPTNEYDGYRAKILVVDDDPVNLKIMKEMLVKNYDVMTATNGKDVLQIIRYSNVDLIISDVMMPHMSGYELTEKIREHFSRSDLPILLITARNQLEDIYTGFQAGANDYIAKPVDATELKARVKALTELRQSIKEQQQIEAAWLQAQIQPHFIFNTLNTIASLSNIDQDRMIKLIGEFGNYLQRSFDSLNTNALVPLQNELELIRSYLYIEKQRFGDRLTIEWKIDDIPELNIPPLSIQPIVENAVRHGVLKRIEGGKIEIQITRRNKDVTIIVKDNGVGMKQSEVDYLLEGKSKIHKGIGIANTNLRLQKTYGKGLEMESKEDVGTTVTFQVPISEKAKEIV